MGCLSRSQIIDNGGSIVHNSDGSVSVFVADEAGNTAPYFLTMECCNLISADSSPYTYNIDSQECRWTETSDVCSIIDTFKIILNPLGNDGVMFSNNEAETCNLEINFDYLFNVKCEDLVGKTEACFSAVNSLESLNVFLTLETVNNDNTLTTVFEAPLFNIGTGNLYKHITTNENSGYMICTTDSSTCDALILGEAQTGTCTGVQENIINGLAPQALLVDNIVLNSSNVLNYLSANTFNSNWLSYSKIIDDKQTLDLIGNKKIKLSIKIKDLTCINPCILVDKIKLNRVCKKTERSDIFVNKSPGFDLLRIVDNKKSWVSKEDRVNREHDLTLRETDYDLNHYKLAINTKEVDLGITGSNAIENDVWCYIQDNSCLLESIVNINSLLTTPISGITNFDEFKEIITSELIDVKNRKSISAYPTLRLIYDRYLNSFCGTGSNNFNYLTMDTFAGLIGTYWVDLIEQVIPSTTIWGSTFIYSNSMFDRQKYEYKTHSLFTCTSSASTETNIGEDLTVSVSNTIYSFDESGNTLSPVVEVCDGVYVKQWECGSEFIGSISIIGSASNPCDNSVDSSVLSECALVGNIDRFENTLIMSIGGAILPVTYLWSNGETTDSITVSTIGTYTCTVTDAHCCSITRSYTVDSLSVASSTYTK